MLTEVLITEIKFMVPCDVISFFTSITTQLKEDKLAELSYESVKEFHMEHIRDKIIKMMWFDYSIHEKNKRNAH